MKRFLALLSAIFCFHWSFSQVEISTGYAVNKTDADGVPVQVGYDFKIHKRLFTKSQLGYKYLYHFNDFVGAKLKVSTVEFHQTLSFEVVKKKRYILKPNVGINYRFYYWRGEMVPPLNTLPLRAWVVGTREGNFVLVSSSAQSRNTYRANNPGFSIQIQTSSG